MSNPKYGWIILGLIMAFYALTWIPFKKHPVFETFETNRHVSVVTPMGGYYQGGDSGFQSSQVVADDSWRTSSVAINYGDESWVIASNDTVYVNMSGFKSWDRILVTSDDTNKLLDWKRP